jgi:hypothetical protein
MDAGFRSYWRGMTGAGSRIVMDSPPDKEDVRPWLRLHALLDAGGVRVPRVLAQDADAGFLLLEDLGAGRLHASTATTPRPVRRSVTQLLQAIAHRPTCRHDEELLARELRLFDDGFSASPRRR